ncbi:MAG TPA: alpha/beta fold hydrolase [Dongiaceae bacterium]|nr:alpha/beta fold hydrolase [Dongiaceae bacterium]
MTTLPTVELTVYAYECDAYGHLNHATAVALLERARWESLARGPGIDLFHRNGVMPVVRKATVEYRAAVFPGDVLRVELTVAERGTTSWTVRHVVTRASDTMPVFDGEVVLVCLDRTGRPTPLPDELATLLGPRTSGAHGTRRVVVAGGSAELAVDVRGDGVAVLFVHGFPFDRTLWRHQLAALTRYRRIAPDLRGVGESRGTSDEYSMARYAEDLAGLLDALDVRRAVVCGLSMGGYIAFEMVRRYPERVRALMLCDTRASADAEDARRRRDELAALAGRDGPGAVGERLIPNLLGAATRAERPEVQEQLLAMSRRYSVPGMAGALRAMRDRPDSTRDLPKITVPTLVMVGAEDPTSPPAVMKTMADAIPGARYVVVPAAGHASPLEQPLASSRAMADFLDGLPASEATG